MRRRRSSRGGSLRGRGGLGDWCRVRFRLRLGDSRGGGAAGGPVIKAKITVHKPNAPIIYEFEDVSVTVKAKRS